MSFILIYIIKSSFCLILFYMGYKALLSHEACFRFNRKVILGGMVVCLLIPFIKLKTTSPSLIQQPFIAVEQMFTPAGIEQSVQTTEKSDEQSIQAEKIPYSGTFIFTLIYMTGIGVSLLLLLRSSFSLYCLIQSNRGRIIRMDRYLLVLTAKEITPFNWCNYIVVSETDYHNYSEEILTHELAHYNKHHSWDLAFAEGIILLHWFNPAAWLLKRELQDIHEYQADTEVLKSGINATRYQLLLVKKAVGSSSYTLANSFNQSKLKKRITMMLRDQSKSAARWKLALLLPVAASALYAFARPDVNRQLQQLIPSEVTTIPQDNNRYTKEYFDAAINTYLRQIGGDPSATEKEKIEKLRTETNTVDFFINRKDNILFGKQVVTYQALPALIEAAIKKDYGNNKPVMFLFIYDKSTSEDLVNKTYALVADLVENNKASSNTKVFQPLLFNGSTKNFGLIKQIRY